MKNIHFAFIFILSFFIFLTGHTNGVLVKTDQVDEYAKLVSLHIEVKVENQVAITHVLHHYRLKTLPGTGLKFGFPLPETASATKLRYCIDSVWYKAKFSHKPQDSVINQGSSGSDKDPLLDQYLGNNPLIYTFNEKALENQDIQVEIEYVELLPYEHGNVIYAYPNHFNGIQADQMESLHFSFGLNSGRTINSLSLISHTETGKQLGDHSGTIILDQTNVVSNRDIRVKYSLKLDEFGLFSISSFLPDSLVGDPFGNGFFAYVVEPDPGTSSQIINKSFTLIIDRSGSMQGNKIVQARDAAKFIIENLNAGDYFNIISFSTGVNGFRNEHVPFNNNNLYSALEYIETIEANGSTNISAAFDRAVPDFAQTPDGLANIIIFFTDGQATAGITNTDALVENVNGLVGNLENNVNIFTFGIGSSVNEKLLTSLANNNGGLAAFLKNDELENVITDFYLKVKNPVLLNTQVSFNPSGAVGVYPSKLPNLYIGNQLLMIGRYIVPGNYKTSLTGDSYSGFTTYNYDLEFSDTVIQKYSFLPKLWAKAKIEDLMIGYRIHSENTVKADSIKNAIIDISLNYGVLSPFTSFSGSTVDEIPNGGISDPGNYPVGIYEFDIENPQASFNVAINAVYPNPVIDEVSIQLKFNKPYFGDARLKLYDATGKLIQTLEYQVNGEGVFDIRLKLKYFFEFNNMKGIVPFSIEIESTVLQGKFVII